MTRTNDRNKKFSQQKTQTGILVSVSAQRLVRQLLADDNVRTDLVRSGERCSQSGIYARALAVYADKIATNRSSVEAPSPAALANQIAALSAALALALNSQESAQNGRETIQNSTSGPKFDHGEPENGSETEVSDSILAPAHGRPVPGPTITNPFAPPTSAKTEI
jgi:hypothetical protein